MSSTLTWGKIQHLSSTFNIWHFHSVSASVSELSSKHLEVSLFTLQPKSQPGIQGQFPCRFPGSLSKFYPSLLPAPQIPAASAASNFDFCLVTLIKTIALCLSSCTGCSLSLVTVIICICCFYYCLWQESKSDTIYFIIVGAGSQHFAILVSRTFLYTHFKRHNLWIIFILI